MMAEKEMQIAQQLNITVNNSFIEGLTKQLVAKEEFGLSFPKDYNVANSLMGAYLILKETLDKNGKPLLETCSQPSIANALMDMATLGLSVQKKQGYFIAYGGKCQFQRSYFGNITIARRFGLKSVNAEVVYADDDFQYHIEDGIKVLDKHIQKLENIDNNKIIGAYAVVNMTDGSRFLEVMNMKQIKQSWQQGYGYKEGSGTHSKFADQMAKKTVINRALKQIINTHGDVFVQEADERTEDVERMEQVEADVAYEIEANANKEEFVIDEPPVIEEKPAPKTVADVTAGVKDKEPVGKDMNVSTKEKKQEMPPFMKNLEGIE
jgi:recombination protein RecT